MTEFLRDSGFVVERRALFRLPALAAATALPASVLRAGASWSGAQPAAAGAPSSDRFDEAGIDFDGFAERCEELAGAHLRGGRINPDVLLHAFAALGARLDAADVPRGKLGAFGGYDPPVEIGPIHRAPPVLVIQWRLLPDAVLPAHNHTPGYVLSLCLEGECRVRHFEIDGDAPAPGAEGAFRIRATHTRILRPGLGTSLTPERDNIHTFAAGPKGALGIDINVFLPGEGDWSMLDFRGTGGAGFDDLYDARWTGKPGKPEK